MTGRSHRLALLAASATALAALLVLPVGFESHGRLVLHHAVAGNGHGNSNGNGGGNSNGNGGAGSNASGGGNSSGNGGGNSNGNAGGNSNGNSSASNGNAGANAGIKGNSDNFGDDGTGGAAGLGSLNAAHASSRAFANASDNSEVGRIRAYSNALDTYRDDVLCGGPCAADLPDDIHNMALALAAASNKTLTVDTVDDLNDLLGQSTAFDSAWDSATAPDIVDQANAAK